MAPHEPEPTNATAASGAARIYDERQRAERVLMSQGRAKGLVDYFPADVVRQLAAWCTPAGEVLPAAVGAGPLVQDFYAREKAAVDAEDGGREE